MDLIINDVRYAVGFAALSRTARKETKYRVTTEDGKVHQEVRAVYLDFALELGNVDAGEYDRLVADVTAAGECVISLPESRMETRNYVGVFDGITDGVLYEADDGVYYDNLQMTFTGTQPLEVSP